MLLHSDHTCRPACEVMIFESVSEMVAAVVDVYEQKPDGFYVDADRHDHLGRHFDGWDDAMRKATASWPDGVRIIESMLESLRDADLPRPLSRRRVGAWSEDDGHEVDFDRLRTGQAFWRTSRREQLVGPATIAVCANVSALASVRHEDTLWRGAAAVCLTYLLESSGYRVEFWAMRHSTGAFNANRRDETSVVQAVCVKRAQDMLDLGSLATSISAWYLRMVFFGANNLSALPTHYGFGVTRSVKQKVHHVTRDESAVVIEDVWCVQDAIQCVKAKLKELRQAGVS